jgi:DNA-binding MarR family transcriptional regulator
MQPFLAFAGERVERVPMAFLSDGWRHSNVGRLLNNAVRKFESRVIELLAEGGHREVRLSYLHLTRNLDRSGTRATELARRAAMTKQAMTEIIGHCEKLGLVKRTADPSDGRAKIVMFTELGLEWLNSFKEALGQAEREMREELGHQRLQALCSALADYGRTFDPLEAEEVRGEQVRTR